MKAGIRQMKTAVLISTLLLLCICVLASSFTAIGPAAGAELLQKEIQRYSEIEKHGGWQKIKLAKSHYQNGEMADAISQVKKRLRASGDYQSKDLSPLFSAELETAVKRVQRQFGFSPSGIIDAGLVLALNVPVEERLTQLQVNLNRLQKQSG